MEETNPRLNREQSRANFIKNPLDKTVDPRYIISYALDKRRAKSMIRKIDKNFQYDNTATEQNGFEITRDFDDVMKEIKAAGYIGKRERKILKNTLYSNPILSEKHRKDLWYYGSGAKLKKELYGKHYYTRLLHELKNYPDYFSQTIEKDLNRTFSAKNIHPDEIMVHHMRQILNCYAKRNPAIGYCQGLSFVAARIIQVIKDEEKSFWILATFLEDILPIDYFSSMVGVLVDQRIFSDMVYQYDKDLGRKFIELEMEPSLFSLQWFVCCYVSTLPPELCFSVWDLLFAEGGIILFKTGLAYLSFIKQRILEVTGFNEMFTLIDEINDPIEPVEFVNKIKKIYISKRLINIMRNQYEWIVEDELQKLEDKKKGKPTLMPNRDTDNCQLDWPVCIDVIEKSKQKKKNGSTFSFRARSMKDNKKYFAEEYKSALTKKKHSMEETSREQEKFIPLKLEQAGFAIKGLNGNLEDKPKENPKDLVEQTDVIEEKTIEKGQGDMAQEFALKKEIPRKKGKRSAKDLVIGRQEHTCKNALALQRFEKRGVSLAENLETRPGKLSFDILNECQTMRGKRTMVATPLSRMPDNRRSLVIGHQTFAVGTVSSKPESRVEAIGNFLKGIFEIPFFKKKDTTKKMSEEISTTKEQNILPKKGKPFTYSSGGNSPKIETKKELEDIDDDDTVRRRPRKTLYHYMVDPNLTETADSARKSILFMHEFFKE